MYTFQETLTNEDYEQVLHDLPSGTRDLALLQEAERIWEGFMDYHSFPTFLDCIENDTELMDDFFCWLDGVVLNLEHVKDACLYYLINSPDDKGKNFAVTLSGINNSLQRKHFILKVLLNHCIRRNQKIGKDGNS